MLEVCAEKEKRGPPMQIKLTQKFENVNRLKLGPIFGQKIQKKSFGLYEVMIVIFSYTDFALLLTLSRIHKILSKPLFLSLSQETNFFERQLIWKLKFWKSNLSFSQTRLKMDLFSPAIQIEITDNFCFTWHQFPFYDTTDFNQATKTMKKLYTVYLSSHFSSYFQWQCL